MTLSDESWLAVQLDRVGEAAEDAWLSEELASVRTQLHRLNERARQELQAGTLGVADREILAWIVEGLEALAAEVRR